MTPLIEMGNLSFKATIISDCLAEPLTPLKGGIRTRQSVNYFSANMKDAKSWSVKTIAYTSESEFEEDELCR
jgi:hypothetical protein